MKEYELELKSKPNKTCAIRYLSVDKKYRGFGIAKSLVTECINHAKKDKNNRIILHTMNSMKEAIKIYEQFGFLRFEIIDFRNNGIYAKGYYKKLN